MGTARQSEVARGLPRGTAWGCQDPPHGPVSEGSAGAGHRAAVDDYDSFAEAYAAETEANLVSGYYALEDWEAPLAELRRVLKSGGRLIAPVDQAFVTTLMHREQGRTERYVETYNWTEEWTFGGHAAPMSFWHGPLHAMTDAFTTAGFRISVISEPPAAPPRAT